MPKIPGINHLRAVKAFENWVAHASRLLFSGFKLVFLGARNPEAGEAAVQKLKREAEKEGSGENTGRGAITALKIDVSKPDSIKRWQIFIDERKNISYGGRRKKTMRPSREQAE
jgi:hypothetical protein